MANILIRGAAILTLEEDDGLIENGEIAVQGDRIAMLGPRGTVPADYRADRVLDGAGLLALPGFINCHTHAAMTLLRSYADDLPLMEWLSQKIWPVEDKLEPEDIYWGTMLCCLEMIKSGTTTFADMYFMMDETARAVAASGLRACLSRGMIGSAANAAEALAESEAFYKNWHGAAGGRIKVMFGPHAPYTCPPEYLKQVIALAGKYGAGLHIHVAETPSEVAEIQASYGKTPVGHLEALGLFALPVLAAHCVHLTEADIAILARRGVGVAHCPESNMKLASGIAPAAALIAAGVRVGLGTDGAASNNNLDMLGEMRSAALLQKVAAGDPTVLPAPAALRLATVNGAQILGLAGVTGRLKEGMKADLLLVDTRRPHFCPRHNLTANLVYAAHAADVATVIVDGEILMENRQVLTIDEEQVLWEAQRRAERLAG